MTKHRLLFMSALSVIMLTHAAFAYAITPDQEHLKKADELVQQAAKDFAAHDIEAAVKDLEMARKEVEAYDATETAILQHKQDRVFMEEIDQAKELIIDPTKADEAVKALEKTHKDIYEQVVLF